MTWLELVLLAVSLSLDTLAVSVSGGLCLRRKTVPFRIPIAFAFFQTAFAAAGLLAGAGVSRWIGRFDHWVAFLLLGYIGLKMIRESCSSREENGDTEETIDLMRPGTLLVWSVATSIDALAVGITIALLHLSPARLVGGGILIFCITFLASLAGLTCGAGISSRFGNKVGIAGGAILIGIGIKILLEHLAL